VAYGNWLKINDTYSDKQVWVPPSGFVAAKFAEVDRNAFPWSAIGGFNRGSLSGVTDIGIVTNQKQRDLLYKININPIAFFPNDGFVIYGQKTRYLKPSAFDRLNVRRLFLHLEKATQDTLKFFLFEPNTFTTRTRLVGALTPIFEQARINDGLYSYNLICDERNNSSDVIDNNELRVSIYIQAVRTGEFILADFVATRTGVNFNELIG
jgi:phage tail sheath protein FI